MLFSTFSSVAPLIIVPLILKLLLSSVDDHRRRDAVVELLYHDLAFFIRNATASQLLFKQSLILRIAQFIST